MFTVGQAGLGSGHLNIGQSSATLGGINTLLGFSTLRSREMFILVLRASVF
jgi:hypothetical protein